MPDARSASSVLLMNHAFACGSQKNAIRRIEMMATATVPPPPDSRPATVRMIE